jgi:pilus assembly protein FimV
MPDNINNKNDDDFSQDDLSLNFDDLGSDTLSFSEDIESLDPINTDEISLDDLDLDTPVETSAFPEESSDGNETENIIEEIDISEDTDIPVETATSSGEKSDGDETQNTIEEIDISEDLDKFEIDNTSQDIESVDLDSASGQDTKIDTDLDNFDLENFGETSIEPAGDEVTEESDFTKLDDLDLKSDLGLKDELNISNETKSEMNENLSSISIDEYGVDLKSGPITISTYDQPNSIIGSDLDEVLKNDKNILNINIPEKDTITIDDDQADFLTKDLEIEEIPETEMYEKKNISDEEIESLSLDILEDQALNSVSAKELITDEDIQKLDDSKTGSFDLSEDNLVEDIPGDLSVTEDNSEYDAIEETKDDILIEDIPEIGLVDEDVLKTDLDLDDQQTEILKSGDDMKKDEENSIKLDIEDISGLEDEIFPSDTEMPLVDEEISNTSITGVSDDLSNSITPLSDSTAVFTGTDEFSDDLKIEGLDTISDESMNIDIDNIPEKTISSSVPEEEIIGFSKDELDDILNATDIIETPADDQPKTELVEESETIDLSNFEADLKEIGAEEISLENDLVLENDLINEVSPVEKINISPEEEEEIYNSLKSEMQKKSQKETKEINEDLKDEVKSVLSYLDKLLDALPDEKIKEFAESEAFLKYKKLFDELNIKN